MHYLEAERRTPPFARGGCTKSDVQTLRCTMTKLAHEEVRVASVFDRTTARLSRHRGLAAMLVLMLGACGDPGSSTGGAGGRTGGGGSGGASGGSGGASGGAGGTTGGTMGTGGSTGGSGGAT